jgi:hypothetical protein
MEILQSLGTADDPDIASKQIVRPLFAVAKAFWSVAGADLLWMVARGGESAFRLAGTRPSGNGRFDQEQI